MPRISVAFVLGSGGGSGGSPATRRSGCVGAAGLAKMVVLGLPEIAPGLAVVGVETPVDVVAGAFASGVALLPDSVPTVAPAVGELAEVVLVPVELALGLVEPCAAPALGFVALLTELVGGGLCAL